MPPPDDAARGRSPRTRLVALAWIGCVGLSGAHATEPDVAGLEREVATLRATVQRLQARVERLERQAAPEAASASGTMRTAPTDALLAPARTDVGASPALPGPDAPIAAQALAAGGDPGPQARLRINWSRIAAGMASTEVSSLLGAPSRRLTLDGRTVWYYSYPALGNGSVFFTAEGRVSSHQSPFAWGG